MESVQTVYSNFTHYIEPGETTFTVKNPNTVRDGINRLYSFGYLELVPEYVAEVAEAEEMDDKTYNANVIDHFIKVKAYFENEYSNPTDGRKLQTPFRKGEYDASDVINLMNKGFEENKPPGMIFCPVFLDWTYPALDKAENFKEYAEQHAPAFYDDSKKFNPISHKGYLPVSVEGPYNDWQLPTNQTVLDSVRVRVTIAPNFRIAMSSEILFEQLGFTKNTFGARGVHNQFYIDNDKTHPITFVADGSPSPIIKLDKTVTITAGVHLNSIGFNIHLKTSSAGKKNIPELVERLNSKISKDAKSYFGYNMGVKINDEQKIEFKIPTVRGAEFILTLPEALLHTFHFLPGYRIDVNNYISEDPVIPKRVTAEEGLAFARILVLDTGPLTVTLSDTPSMTTRGRYNQLMAFLVASGHVSAMIPDIRPVAYFPNKESELTFKIDRNSDKSEIIGLRWPVGCFANGVLIGTPISTDPTFASM